MRFLLLLPMLLFSLATEAANILIIESYHPTLPWVQDNIRGLKSVLGNKHKLDYFYLDTKRIAVEQQPAQAQLAWQRYLTTKPDLVIISDDDAINLLAHRIARNGTQVVYLGMNGNPRQNGTYGTPHITGVLERPLLKRNIVEMSALLGSPQKALVLFDDSSVSKTALKDNFSNNTNWQLDKLKVDIAQTNSYSRWQEIISSAHQQGYEMIFIGLYHTLRDASGNPVEADDAISWAGTHCQVPIFGFWDFSIGPHKAIGGLVLSGYEHGAAAGAMAEELLTRKKENMTPRIPSRGEYLFSRSGTNRWHISIPYDQSSTLWID